MESTLLQRVYGAPRAIFVFRWPFPYGSTILRSSCVINSTTVKRDQFNELWTFNKICEIYFRKNINAQYLFLLKNNRLNSRDWRNLRVLNIFGIVDPITKQQMAKQRRQPASHLVWSAIYIVIMMTVGMIGLVEGQFTDTDETSGAPTTPVNLGSTTSVATTVPAPQPQAPQTQPPSAGPSFAATSPATAGLNCPEDSVTFELITGYVYSAPADMLDSQPGTLMLTDCIQTCRQNTSCQSINYETGLCVLFSSNADAMPGITHESFTFFLGNSKNLNFYLFSNRCFDHFAISRLYFVRPEELSPHHSRTNWACRVHHRRKRSSPY